MTDRETLLSYRLQQARESLQEAERMLAGKFSARATINRAYYAMFYAVLALLLSAGVAASSSKHTGVLAIFDREFILPGTIDRSYSRMLHRMFDRRLEYDYKECVDPSVEDARTGVAQAREFVGVIEAQIGAH
jgi:uncharacterized protein (UPF0332 family)